MFIYLFSSDRSFLYYHSEETDHQRYYERNICCPPTQTRSSRSEMNSVWRTRLSSFSGKSTQIIWSKITKANFPGRNTDLVMGEQTRHQPYSPSDKRRVKTDVKCCHCRPIPCTVMLCYDYTQNTITRKLLAPPGALVFLVVRYIHPVHP